jgi:cell division protein FtsI/penicillin-binding protein 2
VLIVVSCLTVVALGAGAAAYLLTRTAGSARATAAEYLAAWQRGDVPGMQALVADPPADFTAAYTRTRTSLGVTHTNVRLDTVTKNAASFTATLTLNGVGDWTYQGSLPLAVKNRKWLVSWTPAAQHPALRTGQHLALKTSWPVRAGVLAADGTRIDTGNVSGSVQLLVGTSGPATAAQAAKLGAPYAKGDPIGHGGIEEQFQQQLAGTPSTSILVVDAAGHATGTPVGKLGGKPGTEVKTSLDLRIQAAAAKAITHQGKPAALVAIRPSTGEILAVANQPGGFSRAMLGQYPPGSTFKVVTAASLLSHGLTPASSVTCANTATIGGQKFHNFEGEKFGPIDLRTAFAKSCNTAFATAATQKLTGSQLAATAQTFGFDTPLNPGSPAARSKFPLPRDTAEFASQAFGQGRVTATPLAMAAVAAAVQNGTWRSPFLVTGGKPGATHPLASNVVSGLRDMMSAVVTSGTAMGAKLPAGTAGKTGTAEYGSGAKPPTHAWFIGYRGDLAFAIIVEGGGIGGSVAAPLAATFLSQA